MIARLGNGQRYWKVGFDIALSIIEFGAGSCAPFSRLSILVMNPQSIGMLPPVILSLIIPFSIGVSGEIWSSVSPVTIYVFLLFIVAAIYAVEISYSVHNVWRAKGHTLLERYNFLMDRPTELQGNVWPLLAGSTPWKRRFR
jgi:hypothetical protein